MASALLAALYGSAGIMSILALIFGNDGTRWTGERHSHGYFISQWRIATRLAEVFLSFTADATAPGST